MNMRSMRNQFHVTRPSVQLRPWISTGSTRRVRRGKWGTAAQPAEQQGKASEPPVNEDVLARLRQAEEELAKLKQQLGAQQQPNEKTDVLDAPAYRRIDSTDNRETLDFSGSKKGTAWLTEADVGFFTEDNGNSVQEALGTVPEEQAVIQKRLLIGGVLSVGVLALAFIPTETFRPKPRAPLFFYLVPLLRIQELLVQCKDFIDNAQWSDLRVVLRLILGPPNEVRSNLDAAIGCLEDPRSAEKAAQVAAELVEYLQQIDYNKYFDAVPQAEITGSQQAEFVKFSSNSLLAAQKKLKEFLALMPYDQLGAAKQQVGL